MRVRTVTMRVRLLLSTALGMTVTMRMFVIMPVVVTIAVRDRLRHRMAAWVALVAMAVIVTMRRLRVHRLRNPTLLANFCGFGGFIVVLSTTSLSMSNEAIQ